MRNNIDFSINLLSFSSISVIVDNEITLYLHDKNTIVKINNIKMIEFNQHRENNIFDILYTTNEDINQIMNVDINKVKFENNIDLNFCRLDDFNIMCNLNILFTLQRRSFDPKKYMVKQ